MKVAIFGAGKAGQYLYSQINKFASDISVDAFIDSKMDEKVSVEGVSLYRPNEYLKNASVDAVIIAAGAQKAVLEMTQTIRKNGIYDIYVLQDIAGKNKLPLFFNGDFISTRIRKLRFSEEKPSLPYFEMPIIDSCNLNCKGCLFGCNRNGVQEYMTLEEIEKDFKRMAELFEDIPWIRILGGEPLLHPEIKKVMELCRKVFGDSEIDLCTNGLLIPKLDDDILESFVKNRITIHISGYKPTYKMMPQIEERLSKFNLDYTVLKRDKFYKFYTINDKNDPNLSHGKCMSSGCRELYKGRLSKCSGALAFTRLNEQFGTNYEVKRNVDWFDIHDQTINAWDIERALNQPAAICKYCSDNKMEYFDWSNNEKACLEDYIIKE